MTEAQRIGFESSDTNTISELTDALRRMVKTSLVTSRLNQPQNRQALGLGKVAYLKG